MAANQRVGVFTTSVLSSWTFPEIARLRDRRRTCAWHFCKHVLGIVVPRRHYMVPACSAERTFIPNGSLHFSCRTMVAEQYLIICLVAVFVSYWNFHLVAAAGLSWSEKKISQKNKTRNPSHTQTSQHHNRPSANSRSLLRVDIVDSHTL